MPEPVSIAVATILAAKAAEGFAGETGKGAFALVRHLVGLLHRKFAGDPAATEDLIKIEQNPQDEGCVAVLAETINRHAQNDERFRTELVDLLGQAQRDPETASFVTTVLPGGVIGKVTNIGDVHGNVSF